MLQVEGLIKEVFETNVISDKFKKREFLLTIKSGKEEEFEDDVLFEVHQDRVSILDEVRVGDKAAVSFNLRGKEYTPAGGETKYFNSLVAWQIKIG